jgi:hypothetical protein
MTEQQKDPMQVMAKAIDTALNGHTLPLRFHGFVLLVFPFDGGADGTMVNYVANCDRKDMIVAMKEMVARFEGQAQTEGHS